MVDHCQKLRTLILLVLSLSLFRPALADPVVSPRRPPESYTLQQLQKLAYKHNPTLKQAAALVKVDRARALQAGLWPNPVLSYEGDQIGLDGTPGDFQGGLIRQRIVTGGKLALSREKYEARADAARDNLAVQRLRVGNDVASTFYQVLGARAKLALYDRLLDISKDHYKTTIQLANLGKRTRADLQMAEVSLEKARLDRFMAEPLPGWDTLMARTVKGSPQVRAARDEVRADKITVEREEAQPIPDLYLEAGVGHDYADRQTVYMAGLSLQIPLFDQNQGTIEEAKADMEQDKAEIRRLRLKLRRECAREYSMYLTALQMVLQYRHTIVPRSRKAFQMQLAAYRAARINWYDVLHTERAYVKDRLELVDQMVSLQQHRIALEGYLLKDGLHVPDKSTTPGHAQANPKPR